MKQLLRFSDASIWRHRDLRLMLPARAISAFGDDMTLIVLTLRVFDAGLGPWSIAGLLVCGALPVVVLAPLAGRLVDTMPFRTLAATTALWQALCCTALAFATPLWSIYALVLALQVGHVVAGPTWQALVPSIVDRDEIGRVVSVSQAMSTVALVAAPAAAGLAVAWLGYRAPLLLDAATFVVLAAAGLAIRAQRVSDEAPSDRAADGTAREPFRLRSDALLWPLIAGLCVLVVAAEVTNVVEVFLLRGTLGASSAAFGLVAAVLAGGVVVGSVLAGRALPDASRARRASFAAVVLTLALVAAGLAPALWVFAVAWAVVGVANGMVNADASTLLLNRAPGHSRGRVLARVHGMIRGSALGAMALGAAAGALLGPRATFVAAGALGTVVATLLFLRIRSAVARTRQASAASIAATRPGSADARG
jgi:MFS family permease